MLRILVFLFLLSPLSVLAQTEEQPQDYHKKVKIPTAWIEQIRHLKEGGEQVLLEEFESYTSPDSIYLPGYLERDHKSPYLKYKFVNLDEDPEQELIANIGWDITHPSMVVFKKIGNTWYLLYQEPFYIFYVDPEIDIASNVSKNKVFYLRRMYERGSGIHSDAFDFFRLMNNRVYPCLELVNKTWIYGWELYINQKVKTKFCFSDKGNIHVHYIYNFFPGNVLPGDLSWEGHKEISLISGDENVNYYWDKAHFVYKQKVSPDPSRLNPEKVACFGAFGNDSLFTKAFAYDIQQTIKNGTTLQKKILKGYVKAVREHKQPATELRKKAQIGDLNFYGPK